MYNLLIVKYGEIGVKGKNRYIFENKLIKNIKNVLNSIGEFKVYKEYGRIYVDLNGVDYNIVANEVKKVFGVVGVAPAVKEKKSYDGLKNLALEQLKKEIENGAKTFKVETKRGDKSFSKTSFEMSADIGGYLLKNLDGKIKVDVKKPDVKVICEYRREWVMCYTKVISGFGGLPVGTNGRAMVLLSGGIDSPVSAWEIAKRGMSIEAVHFHSYPFTNERSQDKVRELAKIISKYTGEFRLHMVNLTEIHEQIAEKCRDEERTILARRFMMRIAEKISNERNFNALVTGESIGQVASQTIEGLTCTNDAVDILVLRPLITMDKIEIIKIAEMIETYETSIIPEADCCSLFAPKKPITKPKVDRIRRSEEKLDVEGLVERAVGNMTTELIKY